jgi:molybdopterin converting factor small subunit
VTTVRIPPVLRESAGGSKQVDLAGATVGEVLAGLVGRYPALRDQLYGPDGRLNRFVNVYLNQEDVRYLSELDTPATDRDTIVVLPAMAGGSASPPCRDGSSPDNRRRAVRRHPRGFIPADARTPGTNTRERPAGSTAEPHEFAASTT